MAIIKSTIQLGDALQLQVLAEEIETKEQYEILDAFGCDMAQGFLFSLPMLITQVDRIAAYS